MNDEFWKDYISNDHKSGSRLESNYTVKEAEIALQLRND